VVQGLAWGLDIPVVPVSSLAAVALQAIDKHQLPEGACVAVAFDARMGEVYWGTFQCRDGLPVLLADERVCPPSAVSLPDVSADRWIGVGSGWAFAGDMPADVAETVAVVDDTLVPRACEVVRLAEQGYRQGEAVPAEQAQPVYIRDEVAWKKLPGRD
tara:strand:- start:4457 stop:4930 length:474 start_codon:yes stop_codon:yes gene_type:complete